MDAQMKKGILEMCILHLLAHQPLYGYEVMKALRQEFPEVYEGSIYAILRRLHKEGWTQIQLQASTEGPPRKYYALTREGQDYLKQMKDEWQSLKDRVQALGL